MVCVTVSNIVRQVAVLPFFTGNLHCCVSGCCAPFLLGNHSEAITLKLMESPGS